MPSILVVDDQPAFTLLVSDVLEDAGYDVIEANSGAEALALLEEHAPDLVITDLNMPGIDGGELLRRVKEIFPGVPVVIVSGEDSTKAAVACMKTGASDFLLKPCEEERLLAVVQQCLESSQEQTGGLMPTHPNLRQIAGYMLSRRLGVGTFGTVYLAEKTVDGRAQQFAMKILHKGLGGVDGVSAEVYKRFRREAEVTAAIRHPHIVRLVEFQVEESLSLPYVVMQYLPGQPLTQIPYHELSWREVTTIIRQVASALQVLHERMVVHRDVKPGNIMISRSPLHATLMDFGVVGLSNSELTNTDMTVGTPLYMAPETFTTSHVSGAADIFSLGIVAHEYITGRHPFDVGSLPEITDAIRFRPLPPIDPNHEIDLPPPLITILERMLAKRPSQRFDSAGELVVALDRVLADHPA